MKKSLSMCILLCLFTQLAYACVCVGEIIASFKSVEESLTTSLNEQIQSIKQLNKKTQKYIEVLVKQEKELKKLNAIAKEENIKNSEILFLLQKKNNLR